MKTRAATSTLSLAAKILLTLVSLFWCGFVVLAGSHELFNEDGSWGTLVAMLAVGLPLLWCTATAWIAPRVSGVSCVVCAVYAAWFFDHTFTRLAMALPLFLAGLALLVTPCPSRTRGKPHTS